jgi:hypothetical protein
MKKWIIIVAIVAIVAVAAVLVTNWVNQNNTRVAEMQEQLDELANAPAPANAAAAADSTVAQNGEYLTVYRGATDEQTINFDDAWPGFYATATNIDWTDNSFHMKGGNDTKKVGKQKLACGTYTVEENGVISGDVWVNGEKICDDNEKTFLVVNVKKGDEVIVINDWQAWFTSHYSEELVVAARQAAHPTWTRQKSPLN